MVQEEKEKLYKEAKDAYYEGNPFLTDEQFDTLEEELLEMGSEIIKKVGVIGLKEKTKHLTPMLSLDKIKFYSKDFVEHKSLSDWIIKTESDLFEITPKFDGSALNIIVKNLQIDKVLTRGNGIVGIDVTDKMKNTVSKFIPFNELEANKTYEIRGECLIAIDCFNEKFKQAKNPRNLVSGIVNRKDSSNTEDLTLMIYEIKEISNEIKYKNIEWNYIYKICRKEDLLNKDYFKILFSELLNERENNNFQQDGFVIKVFNSEDRFRLKESEHHPKWALAIKFPAKETITKILDIEWNVGKTGELTPVAVLEPVLLDGTMVSRCSLSNLGYVKENLLSKDAEVSIYKAGDIIPQIDKVIKQGTTYVFPENCPSCGDNLVVDGVHLFCTNDNCFSRLVRKLGYGLSCFKLDFLGGSTVKKLVENDLKFAYEIFLVDLEKFLNSSHENYKKIQKQINSTKKIHIKQLILSFAIDDLGGKTAEQIAKKFSNTKYDFTGLQRNLTVLFDEGTFWFTEITTAINRLIERGIEIEFFKEEIEDSNTNYITYEMTGSPKSHGWKVKEEFVNAMSKKGWRHTNLTKETNYLICDDVNGNSNKIQNANKLNVKVINYSEAIAF